MLVPARRLAEADPEARAFNGISRRSVSERKWDRRIGFLANFNRWLALDCISLEANKLSRLDKLTPSVALGKESLP